MTEPALPMSADAVLIGAGVVGCSIALQLARAGLDVAVLDRNRAVGAGSTSASSAVIRFHYSTRAGVITAWESKFGWERWGEFLGHEDPAGLARYIPTGGLVLESPGFALDRVTALFTDIGIPFEVLSPAQLRERFPALDTGRYYPPKALSDERSGRTPAARSRALWTPDGGYVHDPQLAAQNLMHAARAEGARLVLGADDRRDRDQRRPGYRRTHGRRHVISAPIVVNAAGPHSGHVNDLAGVRGRVRDLDPAAAPGGPPRRAAHRAAADRPPHVGDADLGTYFRPEPGGGLLVGGQEPELRPAAVAGPTRTTTTRPTTAVFEAQVTRLARRLPDLPVATRPAGIAGVYDVTDDWIPVYDRTSLARVLRRDRDQRKPVQERSGHRAAHDGADHRVRSGPRPRRRPGDLAGPAHAARRRPEPLLPAARAARQQRQRHGLVRRPWL